MGTVPPARPWQTSRLSSVNLVPLRAPSSPSCRPRAKRHKDGGAAHHGTWTTKMRNEGLGDRREARESGRDARAGAFVGWRGGRERARWAVLVSAAQRIKQIDFLKGLGMSYYYRRLGQTSFFGSVLVSATQMLGRIPKVDPPYGHL